MNILPKPEREAAVERLERALSNWKKNVISEYVNKILAPLPHRFITIFEKIDSQLKREREEVFKKGDNLESYSRYKVQQAEKRIKERTENIMLKFLEFAINIGDRPAITKYLRKIEGPIPKELARKLADYLDPERPSIKSGPKESKTIFSRPTTSIINLYRFLCNNREAARWLFNVEKEEFHITEQSPLLDDEGNFSPEWVYPQRNRIRNSISLPRRGSIKEYVCKRYGVKSRRFDDIFSADNKDIIEFYNRLCVDTRFSGDEPKRFTCQMYYIKSADLDKMLPQT